MDHLKQALKNRRGKGLDINIIISGPPKDEEHSEQKTDLAPPGDDKESESMIDENEDGMDNENKEMQEALMDGMGEHDKAHLQQPGNAKTLGQKARLAAMMNAKK